MYMRRAEFKHKRRYILYRLFSFYNDPQRLVKILAVLKKKTGGAIHRFPDLN